MKEIEALVKTLNDAGINIEAGYHCIQGNGIATFRGSTREQIAFLRGMVAMLKITGGAAA